MTRLLILLSIILVSCKSSTKIIEAPPITQKKTVNCENGTSAIIKPFQLDGCSWIIELPEGEKIEPMNFRDFLTESELEEAQPVRVKVEFYDTKSPSICMIGRTVAISCMERLK